MKFLYYTICVLLDMWDEIQVCTEPRIPILCILNNSYVLFTLSKVFEKSVYILSTLEPDAKTSKINFWNTKWFVAVVLPLMKHAG